MRFSVTALATLLAFSLSATASPTPSGGEQPLAPRDPHKFHHGVFNVDKRSLEHFRRERIVLVRRQDNTTTTTTDTDTDTTTTTSDTTTTTSSNLTTTTSKPTTTTTDTDEEEEVTTTKEPPKPSTKSVLKTVTDDFGVQSTVTTYEVHTPTADATTDNDDTPSGSGDPDLATGGAGKVGMGSFAMIIGLGLVGVALL